MSVDILPASLPLAASNHFSSALLPYLESLIEGYAITTPDTSAPAPVRVGGDEYTRALDRATIAENGKLVGKYRWLQEAVDKFHAVNSGILPNSKKARKVEQLVGHTGILRKKRLLMLGSGMVAGPAVDVIAKRGDVQLMIGKYAFLGCRCAYEFLHGLAGNSLREVEKLAEEHLNVRYRVVDVDDHDVVSGLIEESDVVIRCGSMSLPQT